MSHEMLPSSPDTQPITEKPKVGYTYKEDMGRVDYADIHNLCVEMERNKNLMDIVALDGGISEEDLKAYGRILNGLRRYRTDLKDVQQEQAKIDNEKIDKLKEELANLTGSPE